MQAYNSISSAVFDVVMAPFGHRFAGFDLLLWPVGTLPKARLCANRSNCF